MTRTFILSLFLCFVFQAVASADDKLTIFVDKTKFLRLKQPADTISIGNPDMVSLNLKSPQFLILTGLKLGTTDIHIFNKKGNSIFSKELLVMPSSIDTIIVNRGADQTSKYLCAPACVSVPDNEANSTTSAAALNPASAAVGLNASGVK